MNKILTENEIKKFKEDGAILIKGKFDKNWMNKLKEGFKKAKNNPSPRFVSHTKDKNSPSYYEDFWTWNLIPEFKDFVGVVSGSIGFEGAAAVKLAVEASGAITNFTILEEMDMGKAAGMASKAMANYKPAG